MSADMESLAHAWDAGWTAASDRAQRVILLAVTVGTNKAAEQLRDESPVPNPYRQPKSGGGS